MRTGNCIECGEEFSKEKKHNAKGMCHSCYAKSNYALKRKKYLKEYCKEYYLYNKFGQFNYDNLTDLEKVQLQLLLRKIEKNNIDQADPYLMAHLYLILFGEQIKFDNYDVEDQILFMYKDIKKELLRLNS